MRLHQSLAAPPALIPQKSARAWQPQGSSTKRGSVLDHSPWQHQGGCREGNKGSLHCTAPPGPGAGLLEHPAGFSLASLPQPGRNKQKAGKCQTPVGTAVTQSRRSAQLRVSTGTLLAHRVGKTGGKPPAATDLGSTKPPAPKCGNANRQRNALGKEELGKVAQGAHCQPCQGCPQLSSCSLPDLQLSGRALGSASPRDAPSLPCQPQPVSPVPAPGGTLPAQQGHPRHAIMPG